MSLPPDSWESLADAHPPPRLPLPGDLSAQYARMNINAQPFVPNVNAHPFVPVVGGYQQPPFGYQMHGHPQMHPGMYGQPPPHRAMHQSRPPSYMVPPPHQPQHPSQFGQTQANPQQHPRPIPVSQLEAEYAQPMPQQQPHPSSWQHPLPPDPHSASPSPSSGGVDSPKQAVGKETRTTVASVGKTDPLRPGDSVSSNTTSKGAESLVADDWEEMADAPEPEVATDEPSRSQTSSAPVPEKKLPSLDVKSLKSSSAPTLDDSSRKQTSPNLSEKAPRVKTGGAEAMRSSQAPPPKTEDEKENVNIVFIGHVDAGKSTIGGHVMYLTGQVDKRTLDKFEREAREKNRETWYLSWALDTNQEERDKGKTVEVGRASFETDKKRFTILDAPGHAGFVPNMISGAAQADIGVLVISARRGEFETGFERKGQTREHAMLAKTAGVRHLVVLINKMDDPTVGWEEERYEECKTKLTPFLKKVGFNPRTDLFFIPVSGLTGANLKEPTTEDQCPWYSGPAFIPYLNELPSLSREDTGPFRLPIAEKFKDMGMMVMGKVESGGVMKGGSLLLMPNRVPVEALSVYRNEEEVTTAYSGDNIKIKLKGVEEEDLSSGFVLCEPSSPCHIGQCFDAQIVILEHKSIICAGYSAVLHIHTVVEEVQITKLVALIDKKTGKKVGQTPRFIKQDQVAIARLQTTGVICLETFKEFPQMARFTLRDEGKTVAIGKVLKLVD